MWAIMDAYRQGFRNNHIATGTHLCRTTGINLYHYPTSVCSFVGRELYELTPGDVSNAAGDCLQIRALHILNVKLLKGDELVFVDQLMGFLMSEVTAAVSRSIIGVTK